MKATLCILVSLFLVAVSVGTADEGGFVMSKVVTADFPGAVEMTEEGSGSGETIYVDPSALLTIVDVKSASVVSQEGASILMNFTKAGEAKLEKATEALLEKKIALIIDGKLVSAPVVRGVFKGPVHISGQFNLEWAKAVVELINNQLEAKKARPGV